VGPTPPPAVPPPPPPSEDLTISDVRVAAAADRPSVSVAWHTSVPASTVGASSSGTEPTVWTQADANATDHVTLFSNLAPSTQYALSLHAVDQWGRQQSTEVQVATPPRAAALSSSTGSRSSRSRSGRCAPARSTRGSRTP